MNIEKKRKQEQLENDEYHQLLKKVEAQEAQIFAAVAAEKENILVQRIASEVVRQLNK